MTNEDLESALCTIAKDDWIAYQQPALLSGLPKKLMDRFNIDYKEILGSESLKSHIISSSSDQTYRFIEHPTQKAKIGIIPPDVDFEFPDDSTNAVSNMALSTQDIDGFARVLRTLTQDELHRLTLPASLVVRLLDSK